MRRVVVHTNNWCWLVHGTAYLTVYASKISTCTLFAFLALKAQTHEKGLLMVNRRKVFLFFCGSVACFTGVVAALLVLHIAPVSSAMLKKSWALSDSSVPLSRSELNVLFEEVATQRTPATVQLQFIQHDNRPFGPDVLDDFFLREEDRIRHPLEENGKVIGTGFIFSEDGYIVTTGHMLNYMDEVHVILHDRTRLVAEVIGMDAETSIAVLKVDAFNLPVMPIAEEHTVRQGQWVVSIGTPAGSEFSNSVTLGIVSSISPHAGFATSPSVITDAVLSYGNSGGPLIDVRGHLVGMANIPYSQTPYSGFTSGIPAQVVKSTAERIIELGSEDRGRIGVQYTPAIANQALPGGAARILHVEPGSAAEKAGLRRGDIVMAVDGSLLEKNFSFSDRIGATSPGDVVMLRIMRDTSDVEIAIEVSELRNEEPVAPSRLEDQDPQQQLMREMGFTVDNVTHELVRDLEIPVRDGVVVLYVNPTSKSYREGDLRGGMIILEMADKRIRNIKEFLEVYATIPPGVTFLVVVHPPQAQSPLLTALTKPE